jgi:tyrosinase
MVVNLGPVKSPMRGIANVVNMYDYNPRCLRRDLSSYVATRWLTMDNLANITLGIASANIRMFQDELQGQFQDGNMGLHSGGHHTIGGYAGDLYASPVDPAFFLHHTMLDRVWWMWQALHPLEASKVAGTITMRNTPPSRDGTVEDIIDLVNLGVPPIKIKEVMNTMNDNLCYIYV